MLRVAGAKMAPPNPWAARAAMSHPPLWAKPPRRLQRVKRASPNMKMRRRPNRSAARPPSIRNPAKVRVYALITHCWPVADRPRSCRIWGRATLTIEMSRTTMNWAAQHRASTVQVGTFRRPVGANDVARLLICSLPQSLPASPSPCIALVRDGG